MTLKRTIWLILKESKVIPNKFFTAYLAITVHVPYSGCVRQSSGQICVPSYLTSSIHNSQRASHVRDCYTEMMREEIEGMMGEMMGKEMEGTMERELRERREEEMEARIGEEMEQKVKEMIREKTEVNVGVICTVVMMKR